MTKVTLLILALATAACSDKAASTVQAAPTASPTAAAVPPALPADVAAFKAKRDGCDELRGEEPYDKARAAELARETKAACTGTDKALAALKAKYAGNAAVAGALADYDAAVE